MKSDIIKYAFVGGICTIFDISAFVIFAKVLNFNYILVSSIGFSLATLLNYVLCIRFIFVSGARYTRKTEIATIFIVSLLGLLLNQAVLYLLVATLGIEMLLSKLCATAVVFFWNYFGRSSYVFRKG